MLSNKKILVGISGGIAAYKTILLIRLLQKSGAEVKVVLTKNALEFVTKVTLESISKNKVYVDVFGTENDYSTEHISLTDWGDIFIVAPATANIIGKIASGIADDALSTSLLAFNKKVILCPAMNTKMYDHFSVKKNIEFLAKNGIEIIEPAYGDLACGYEGRGRMEEPEAILEIVKKHFSITQDFSGKKVLVSAGPTYEAIDPVRFIGNHSTGIMGYA
ncbi:MAG: bifunctional phosphopantothenoylcysteine decarboxylase/phosphopantothenate--cysteine ligase CoaBC, partial [Bacteroidetes bacterium]|nr:bifunctional phosphopantothenoylcysteine decarboxylase/phosphopantothenate--cysteine ligase CoaBC [Bacteroidota bacterium]